MPVHLLGSAVVLRMYVIDSIIRFGNTYKKQNLEQKYSFLQQYYIYIYIQGVTTLITLPHNILALPPQIYLSQVKIYIFQNSYAKFNLFIL